MATPYANSEKQLLQNVGERIKKLRTEVGFSQEKLAFACGLDRTYIGSVERGERNISVINISKIAKALAIKPSEILNVSNEQ